MKKINTDFFYLGLVYPAFNKMNRCLSEMNGNLTQANDFCRLAPILFFQLISAYASDIAKADRESANAVIAFDQAMKSVMSANGKISPSKRKYINSELNKWATVQCNNAATIVNLLNKKPSSGSNSFAVVCKEMNSVAQSLGGLTATLKRVCGTEGVSFGTDSNKSGTIAVLKKLRLTFQNLGKCIADNKRLSPTPPDCVSKACYNISNHDKAFFETLIGMTSRKQCPK